MNCLLSAVWHIYALQRYIKTWYIHTIANIANMDAVYHAFQTRFAFNVTNQWRENQIFRQTKQGPSELSTDFIRRVEAEVVRFKATAADIRDTILQGLLPAGNRCRFR